MAELPPLPLGADWPLVYAHFGGLPITDAEARNYRDPLAILAQQEVEPGRPLDFVYLPGSIANSGQPARHCLVTAATP